MRLRYNYLLLSFSFFLVFFFSLQSWWKKTPLGKKRERFLEEQEEGEGDGKGKKGKKGGGKGKKGKKGKGKKKGKK